jgi:hypothetical protein
MKAVRGAPDITAGAVHDEIPVVGFRRTAREPDIADIRLLPRAAVDVLRLRRGDAACDMDNAEQEEKQEGE